MWPVKWKGGRVVLKSGVAEVSVDMNDQLQNYEEFCWSCWLPTFVYTNFCELSSTYYGRLGKEMIEIIIWS